MNLTLKPYTMPFLLLQNEEGKKKTLYFIKSKNVSSPSLTVTLAMNMWITQVTSEQAENHPGK